MDQVNVTSAVNAAGSKYWSGNFAEFFKKPLKQTLQSELPGYCPKFTLHDDKLWAPIYSKNLMQVYQRDGEMVTSVNVKPQPTRVAQTSTGEMLLSCAGGGLFVLSEDGCIAVKVAGGSYTDVCVCGDSVYTWDWHHKQIVEFEKDGEWRQKSMISMGFVQKTHPLDTLLVRQCGEDRAQLEFLVSAWDQHTVYLVNSQGDKVRQFGGESEQGDGRLMCPRLCGVDSYGDILVANQSYFNYKLLNTTPGSWRTVYTADSCVYNATMEGENAVWLSRYTGGQYVMTKHEVIL